MLPILERFVGLAVVAVVVTTAGATATQAVPVQQGVAHAVARAGQPIRAVAPTMAPSADQVRWSPWGVRKFECPHRYLCVDAWDPTRSEYKVFLLESCTTRTLINFTSAKMPEFSNNQTSRTRTHFLTPTWTTDTVSVAKHKTRSIDWEPIAYVDVC